MSSQVYIGRRESVGIGEETTPGTSVAPAIWQKQMKFDLDQKTTVAQDSSGLGRVENIHDSAVTEEWVEGSIQGHLSDLAFGYFLDNMYGTCTPILHAGESVVYDNTFAILQTAPPPTLTFTRNNPNFERRHALGTQTDLEIDATVGQYVDFTSTILAKVGVTSTDSVSYVAQNKFTSKHASIVLGGTVAGLTATLLAAPVQSNSTTATSGGTLAATTYFYVITAINGNGETTVSNEKSQTTTGSTSTVTLNWATVTGATGYKIYRSTSAGTETLLTTVGAVITYIDTGSLTPGAGAQPTANTTAPVTLQLKSFKLKISRKADRFVPLGGIDPVSFDPESFGATGEIVLRFNDTSLETLGLANTAKAMSLTLQNTDVTIGVATNPTLSFTAPQVRLSPIKLDDNLDQPITQTIALTFELNTTAGYLIQPVLTNTQNGY